MLLLAVLPDGEDTPPQTTGEAEIERLRNLDQVAYVRFASVYRRFEDVNQFMEELKGLLLTRDE